jgi:hypothetical protein
MSSMEMMLIPPPPTKNGEKNKGGHGQSKKLVKLKISPSLTP